jgi:hypothetical protein
MGAGRGQARRSRASGPQNFFREARKKRAAKKLEEARQIMASSWDQRDGRVERKDGVVQFQRAGKTHRDDGPALIKADGTKSWWRHGHLHRDDGPAVEWADGKREWWLRGNEVDAQAIEALQSAKRKELADTELVARLNEVELSPERNSF